MHIAIVEWENATVIDPDEADTAAMMGDELREFLRKKLDEGLTQTELGTAIQYDPSHISRYVTGERKEPGMRFMLGIAWYFDVPLYEVIRMAGYDAPENPDEMTLVERELINCYRDMGDDDQDMLMRIARGFARDERVRQERQQSSNHEDEK